LPPFAALSRLSPPINFPAQVNEQKTDITSAFLLCVKTFSAHMQRESCSEKLNIPASCEPVLFQNRGSSNFKNRR
jgi:hypothetical protein